MAAAGLARPVAEELPDALSSTALDGLVTRRDLRETGLRLRQDLKELALRVTVRMGALVAGITAIIATR